MRQTKGNASALLGAAIQKKLRTAMEALELADKLLQASDGWDAKYKPDLQKFYRLHHEVMK